jgi:hypothetical protein
VPDEQFSLAKWWISYYPVSIQGHFMGAKKVQWVIPIKISPDSKNAMPPFRYGFQHVAFASSGFPYPCSKRKIQEPH